MIQNCIALFENLVKSWTVWPEKIHIYKLRFCVNIGVLWTPEISSCTLGYMVDP